MQEILTLKVSTLSTAVRITAKSLRKWEINRHHIIIIIRLLICLECIHTLSLS
jgi:hypothetical protein